MPNMREIRERIASIQQILKITNAMYLMSSSKLKKARKALDSTEPYFYKLQETINSVLEHTPHTRQMYFDRRDDIPVEKRKKDISSLQLIKGFAEAITTMFLNSRNRSLKKLPICQTAICLFSDRSADSISQSVSTIVRKLSLTENSSILRRIRPYTGQWK